MRTDRTGEETIAGWTIHKSLFLCGWTHQVGFQSSMENPRNLRLIHTLGNVAIQFIAFAY